MRRTLFIIEVLLIILILHVRLGDPVPMLRFLRILPQPAVNMGTLPAPADLKKALTDLFIQGKELAALPRALYGPKIENGITTWTVTDAQGEPAGKILSSSPLCDHITGYGGPVPLLIALDKNGQILGTNPYKHSESESFVELVMDRGVFDAYNKKTMEEAGKLHVDTISGATMTSSTVVKSLALISQKISGSQKAPSGTKGDPKAAESSLVKKLFNDYKIAGWIILLLALGSCLQPSIFARARPFLLGASVVVLGFWQGSVLSSQVLAGWIQRGIPFAGAAFLATAFILTILLFFRRNQSFYCFFLCPFGAFQELMSRTGFKNKKVQNLINRIAPWTRPAMFILVVAAIFLAPGQDLTGLEPFSAFLPSSAPVSAIVIALVFLILASLANRPWCKGFCPVGEFFDRIGNGLNDTGKSKKASTQAASKNSDQENTERIKNKEMTGQQITNIILASALLILLVKPHLPVNTVAATALAGPDALSVIHSRKSVRKYTDKIVEPEKLDQLVRAGLAAPTAADKRPWDFMVVTDRAMLDSLADVLQYGKMLKQANAAILVLGNLEKSLPDEAADFWVQDCSAASENILLAAESLGLGAVWVGIHPMADRVKAVAKILGCPITRIPLNVIPIGYPDGEFKPKNKYDETVIHKNKW